MKKCLLLCLALGFLFGFSFAEKIDQKTALYVAKNFYQQVFTEKDEIQPELVFTSISRAVPAQGQTIPEELPIYYVFNINEKDGFVIIS